MQDFSITRGVIETPGIANPDFDDLISGEAVKSHTDQIDVSTPVATII